MLETSKDLFWLALAISIVTGTGFLSYVLLRIGKITEEAQKTVKDVNQKLEKVNPVIDEGVPVVTGIIQTLKRINEDILTPLLSVGSSIKGFLGFFDGVQNYFAKKSNKK